MAGGGGGPLSLATPGLAQVSHRVALVARRSLLWAELGPTPKINIQILTSPLLVSKAERMTGDNGLCFGTGCGIRGCSPITSLCFLIQAYACMHACTDSFLPPSSFPVII